ncbi:MAG: hypothetical protein DRP64_14870 [Verrucomicrobia bacterium]|nr:MAG: hypothetical protein DRP64_14870 [Verrucomicrobiota bacterium]
MSKQARQRADEKKATGPSTASIRTNGRIMVGFWGNTCGYAVTPEQAGDLCWLLELEPDAPIYIECEPKPLESESRAIIEGGGE